jgi:RNA polymerase sigma-70 factor (ECF subfamily)
MDTIGSRFCKKIKTKMHSDYRLIIFKGYTQQEASDELAIPLGTVKTK